MERMTTMRWLERQLSEIDSWQSELCSSGQNEGADTLKKLGAHRQWLEHALSRLVPSTQ